MKLKITRPFWQAISLGIIAGMRTTAAPFIANRVLRDGHSAQLAKSPLSFMQSEKLGTVLKIFAACEFIADKLPFTPKRTAPAGLAARCMSGSLAGAGIFKASGGNALYGALLGSVAALASTYGCYLLRKNIAGETFIREPWIGAAEDALVIGAGLGLEAW